MQLIEEKEVYAISPPEVDMLAEFPFSESMSMTKSGAWDKFCSPALKREGFEKDGFKAVKIRLTLEEI